MVGSVHEVPMTGQRTIFYFVVTIWLYPPKVLGIFEQLVLVCDLLRGEVGVSCIEHVPI
jgi:hypothetical protein